MPQDAATYDYTTLKPFFTLTAAKLAAERFAHRFSPAACAQYLEKNPANRRTGPLLRELFRVFHDAMDNEDESAEIRSDADLVRRIENCFRRDDASNQIFQLHLNKDILFVCVENYEHRNPAGELEPQIAVVGMIPVKDGKPDLRVLARARNTCRAPQYGRKGGGR